MKKNNSTKGINMFEYAPEVAERLQQRARQCLSERIETWLAMDPVRVEALTLMCGGLCVDFSKQCVTPEVVRELLTLAERADLKQRIRDLYRGMPVNTSEHRPAWHVAVRSPEVAESLGGNHPAKVLLEHQFEGMRAWVSRFHAGEIVGATGRRITDVVNLGIGGSDLGPRMVIHALKAYHQPGVQVHFVANLDAEDFRSVVKALNPETTLFMMVSKSFTTQETLLNGQLAKAWLMDHLAVSREVSSGSEMSSEQVLAHHFVGVTACVDRALAWGLSRDQIFEMCDFVGGRFSLWSSVGLSIAVAIGMPHFEALLAGGRSMDEHFESAPFSENLPVLMGLLNVWSRSFLGFSMRTVLPYDERLSGWIPYVQQLEMESLGKSVTDEGKPIVGSTGSVVWGEVGTHGQHAFHQLILQGTVPMSLEFMVIRQPSVPDDVSHPALLMNAVAQAEAMLVGNAPQSQAYREVKGNTPSTFLMIDELTPRALGQLIALYEHQVYVQAVMWRINPFDQWGVELGKVCAKNLSKGEHDASTAAWIDRLGLS